ncbi:SDR family oxidoreductase [Zavarzinia sp. CC-PAN008]|uniref:SDR family oxidoreductase n=1 Tax=Zavarzinia sp. CC-PAN008 TaxID=3243332 RepID=UPI003F7480C5
MPLLEGKVALVTGASSGIGEAIAVAYAAEGAKVVIAARRADRLDQVAQRIADAGGDVLTVTADLTDEFQVLALFAALMTAHGQLDLLVNNAGLGGGQMPIEERSLENWRSVMSVNIDACFLCAREAFRIMKPQGGGRIINIGSISSQRPRANSTPYTTSKFAIRGLTQSLALDGREHGIAVSALHPGNTDSEIWGDYRDVATGVEGMMSRDDLARIAVLMAALPPEMNVLEATALPVKQPFIGRG